MGEITQAKAQTQDCPEKEKGFRVAQELSTWDVPIAGVGWGWGMRLQGCLEPDGGGPKCKEDEESGLLCRSWELAAFLRWESTYQS